MYHVQLKIAFIGIAEDKAALWKGIAPKEHFSHSFYTIRKEEDLVRELADEEQLLVVMAQSSFLSPSMVRKRMPTHGCGKIGCRRRSTRFPIWFGSRI